jgi:hypothetical protein
VRRRVGVRRGSSSRSAEGGEEQIGARVTERAALLSPASSLP